MFQNNLFSFCCCKENCKGVVPETSNCPACADTIEVDHNKVEIEKIKETLETLRGKMENGPERESCLEIYTETTETWIR